MEAQEFMELYDSSWFEMGLFKKRSKPNCDENPDLQIENEAEKPELYRVPTTISRSMSDQIWPINTSYCSGISFSPDSVLLTPKLQTILSGKEITDESEVGNSIPTETTVLHVQDSPKKKARSRRRGKKDTSKSLSDLEFEELKGFMDLGFVFSEEDKDSNLVSIIPGLQRLGKKDGEEEESNCSVSRPYLSEAWADFDRRRKIEPLMNWRIPSFSNEIDMKDNLKFWAQTVASAVR